MGTAPSVLRTLSEDAESFHTNEQSERSQSRRNSSSQKKHTLTVVSSQKLDVNAYYVHPTTNYKFIKKVGE